MAGLELSLLGPLQILLGGQPLAHFTYAKARALLVYLAVEMDRPHSRDELVGLLWPDLPETKARNNLRQALADLRQVLGDESELPPRTPPYVLVSRDTIQFNAASSYSLDVAAFSQEMDACAHHRHRHIERCPICLHHMEQALVYYRGDFLTGFTVGNAGPLEEWITSRRELLHQQAMNAYEHLAHFYERRGRYNEARNYVQRQLALEPWREEAHYQLMRLYSLSGQRSAALVQYAACRKLLDRELGVEPSTATTALYERLRNGQTASVLQANSPRRPSTPLPVLPVQLVGRDNELAELADLLADPACRLITLTGPGGIGKTSLALAAAVQQAETFRDGSVFVDLSGATDARFLPDAILTALGAPATGQQSPRQQLRACLRDMEVLILLDNYESLLPDVEILTDLLRYAPAVTWLVTSRERLAVQGENLLVLAGLSHPPANPPSRLPEPAPPPTEYAAVQLFLQRVQQTQHHFAATAQDMAAIVQISRVTEGMPLALELAAAAVRVHSCTTVAAALARGQARLATNLRDLPERHFSIYATFEHSWRLLLPEEQRVFRTLSAFRSGFVFNAAQMVASASSSILASLLDKSLIYCQHEASGNTRYGMHELLRQYAEEKLGDAGELEAAHHRHLHYFTQLAEEAEPLLKTAEQGQWLDQLEREHDNLLVALERALARHWYETAARLAGALSRFWFIRAHVHKGLALLELICAATPTGDVDVPSGAFAKACNSAGWLTFLQGKYAQASEKFALGLRLAQSTGNARAAADALRGLALQALNQQNRTVAQSLAQQSLAIAREANNLWQIGAALNVLGDLARAAGDYQAAAAFFAESQVMLRQVGDNSLLLIVECNAGWTALALGEDQRALALHQHVVRLAYAMGAVRTVCHALDGVASILVRSPLKPQATRAARLLGAAEAVRERANILLELIDLSDYEICLAMAQARLGDEAFAAAWAAGQTLTIEQAVDEALAP